MSPTWTRTWWWRGIVWATATVVALTIAWQTKIGRSLPLTPRHGVHVGDLAAFAVSYTWAALLTTRRPTGTARSFSKRIPRRWEESASGTQNLGTIGRRQPRASHART